MLPASKRETETLFQQVTTSMFHYGGVFVPFSDSESACSVVMDTMFGDEFDDSDSETETEN